MNSLIPFFFIGLVVLFSVLSNRARRQRAAELKKEEQENAAKAVPTPKQPQSAGPVNAQQPAPQSAPQKPTFADPQIRSFEPVVVASPTVTPKKASVKPVARPVPAAATSMSEYETAKKKPPVHTAVPAQTSQPSVNPVLQWNRDSAVQGILYAEILGKPKALRR